MCRSPWYLLPLCLLALSVVPPVAAAEPYAMLGRHITEGVTDDLAGAAGVERWTREMSAAISGLASVKCVDGKAGGPLEPGKVAVFSADFPQPGADLDLGFRDFVDVEVQLPAGFRGDVFLEFAAEKPPGGEPLSRIELPAKSLRADGKLHRYRIDVGLVPRWRGFLQRLALVVAPAAGQGGTVVSGRLLTGDRPGDVVEPNLVLNLKPGMKIEELRKMESKHGCVWWQPSHEQQGFDPLVMLRRTLRMIEETWQIAVNQLGYRDPCLGMDPASKRRRKINQITWYDGFWMSGGDPPHFNVSAGGLRDERWGNPVPHEFAHTVQGGQIDFLNGCHWESHANYIRFCRNYHFREFTGLDSIDFGVLLRSNYFQDHPRLIYADYRPYFYLDSDPDQLGLAPGLSGRLWQTGIKDERLWVRLPKLLPAGVTLDQVVAGMARSWVTFSTHAGEHLRNSHFGPDAEGRVRWFRYMAPLDPVADRPDWFAVPLAKAPMKYGWCFHEIEATGPVVEARLEGIDLAGADEDWRWGWVALGKDGEYTASGIFKPGVGKFEVPPAYEKLVIFVAATPANPSLSYPRPTPDTAVDRHPEHRRYPYEITFRNAKPKARIFPTDLPEGRTHPNGGGFVARTAKVDASAYIGPEARVLGTASVLEHARILDRAVVRDGATVRENAEVSGVAVISGNAVISGHARVRNHAFVSDHAKIRERSRVADLAEMKEGQDLSGDAWVRGVSAPFGNCKIGGFAILDGDYSMAFDLNDGVHFHHIPWGDWYFGEVASKLRKPRGLVACYPFDDSDGAQASDQFGALLATIRGNPVRRDGSVFLDGKDQYLVLDSSLVDAPAATWVIQARFADARAQTVFSINHPGEDGIALGVNAQGALAAVLSGGGKPAVTLAGKSRIPTGVPLTIALRMDGAKAALWVNGQPVASQAWDLPPQAYFHDVASPSPTSIFVGRGSKGSASRFELLEFRAHNVALADEELLVRDAP